MLDGRSDSGNESDYGDTPGGVYRPPRVAAMPYTEGPAKGKKDKTKKSLPSHMLADLSTTLSANTPYHESTSGLSTTVDPTLQSGTARHLQQVEQYETDNFTRLRMSKKDAKKRRAEEEEVAFGGLGAGKGRRLGGFGAELDDLLGEMRNSRAEGAYAQMGKMKRARTGVVEKDEGAGTSGLAGAAGGAKKGGNRTAFDKAARKEGKRSKRS